MTSTVDPVLNSRPRSNLPAALRSSAFRLAVVVSIAFVLDRYVNRPEYVNPVTYIQLPGGYAIIATSLTSTCKVVYDPNLDDRKYSEWQNEKFYLKSDRPPYIEYLLANPKTGERLEFVSESEWRAAAIEKKSLPMRGITTWDLCGVTEFDVRGPFVFGDSSLGGHFLLDTALNRYELFQHAPSAPDPNVEWWKRAVSEKTGKPPEDMKDPRSLPNSPLPRGDQLKGSSPLLKTEDATHGVAIGLSLVALPWVLAPLWRHAIRRPKLA